MTEKKEPLFSTVFREESHWINWGVSYLKAGFCRENRLLLIRKSPKTQKKKEKGLRV